MYQKQVNSFDNKPLPLNRRAGGRSENRRGVEPIIEIHRRKENDKSVFISSIFSHDSVHENHYLF